jgi:ABC-type sugar transport system permease subunit
MPEFWPVFWTTAYVVISLVPIIVVLGIVLLWILAAWEANRKL